MRPVAVMAAADWPGRPSRPARKRITEVFHGLREEREVLKAMALAGDELWTFCSPPESWQLAGRQGSAMFAADTDSASGAVDGTPCG
jgi:hypothetical protein